MDQQRLQPDLLPRPPNPPVLVHPGLAAQVLPAPRASPRLRLLPLGRTRSSPRWRRRGRTWTRRWGWRWRRRRWWWWRLVRRAWTGIQSWTSSAIHQRRDVWPSCTHHRTRVLDRSSRRWYRRLPRCPEGREPRRERSTRQTEAPDDGHVRHDLPTRRL